MWFHVEQSMLFYPFSIPKFSSSQFAKEKSGGKEGTNFSKVHDVKWKFDRFFSPISSWGRPVQSDLKEEIQIYRVFFTFLELA